MSRSRPLLSGPAAVTAMGAFPLLAGALILVLAGGPAPGPHGPAVVEAPVAAIQAVSGSVPVDVADPTSGLASQAPPSGRTGNVVVDGTWLATESGQTGIPARALQAYAAAEIVVRNENPTCHIAWNTLAALGWIESGHGTHADAFLQADGTTSHPIVGPALDGSDDLQAVPATADTEAATGDPEWDHAVGPLQFIGSTWRTWGADANGDGKADPNNIDDAALTAARYLCSAGGDLATGEGWSKAIHAYNHSDAYVQAVRIAANGFVYG